MFSLFLIYSQYIGNSGIPYSPRTLRNDRSVSLMAAYITDTALHLHFYVNSILLPFVQISSDSFCSLPEHDVHHL